MHKIQRKYNCIFIILCLIMTCISLDNIRINNMSSINDTVYPASSTCISSSCSITDEDACTLDMLSSSYINQLNQNNQTSLLRNNSQRKQDKSGSGFSLHYNAKTLPSPLYFYTSVCHFNLSDISNVTDILQYIHDKDGKKKI